MVALKDRIVLALVIHASQLTPTAPSGSGASAP